MQLEAIVRERVAAGDVAGAATEAIRALGPKVVGYLRTVLQDEEDAADAFSAWAEDLWKGLPSFQARSSLRTWSLRLAFNAAMDLRAKAHCRRERRFATSEASALAEEIRTGTVERIERDRQKLADLRAQLSPDEQTLLFLRLDQELSWDEVAEVLSPLDAQTARKRFERLKERLAKLARERGYLD